MHACMRERERERDRDRDRDGQTSEKQNMQNYVWDTVCKGLKIRDVDMRIILK